MPVAIREVTVDTPPSVLMAVIVDFARYPEFLPEMERVTILRREESAWSVAFTLRVIRRIEYTLHLRQTDALHVNWSLVEGTFKSNEGGWTLTPLDDGTRTHAQYRIDIDVGTYMPGSVTKTLVDSTLPAMLQAFKARAESRG